MIYPIFVNPLKRVKHARLAEVEIKDKIILLPTYFTKLKSEYEMKSLVNKINNIEYRMDGYCVNIQDAEILLEEPSNKTRYYQTQLDGKIKPKQKEILNKKLLIIDPQTEVFYYDYKTRNGKSAQQNIISLEGFPNMLRNKLLEINKHKKKERNKIWKDLYETRYLFPLINWYSLYQNKFGADIINPPTPVIDGNKTILRIALYVNQATTDIVRDRFDALPSTYLPIHYNAVRKDGFLKIILDEFLEHIYQTRILIIKLLWFDKLESAIERKNFSKFLTEIDKLKLELDNNLVVFYLDGLNESLYTLMNGVDIYIEPLDGINKPMHGKKGKSEEEKKYDEEMGIKYTKHGNYYLKDTREFIPYWRLLKIVKNNNGYLPCNCKFCSKYHKNLSFDTPSEKWNSDRRMHLINARLEEIEKLKDHVFNNDVDAFRWLAMRDGNKNHIDLLPEES